MRRFYYYYVKNEVVTKLGKKSALKIYITLFLFGKYSMSDNKRIKIYKFFPS